MTEPLSSYLLVFDDGQECEVVVFDNVDVDVRIGAEEMTVGRLRKITAFVEKHTAFAEKYERAGGQGPRMIAKPGNGFGAGFRYALLLCSGFWLAVVLLVVAAWVYA